MRIRITIPASLMVAVLFAGCSSGRFSIGTSTLRVMTFNINHSLGADGTYDLERIAGVINKSDADVVALQEVDRWTSGSANMDMMGRLSDLTGMTYAFSRNADRDGGVTGNGLLTRFPILEEKSIPLGEADRDHDRAMVLVLDVRGMNVIIMNADFGQAESDSAQSAGCGRILTETEGSGFVPVILCCSLRADSSGKGITTLQPAFDDCWDVAGTGTGYTYPSALPRHRFDCIFQSITRTPTDTKTGRTGLQAQSAKVIATEASAHLPVSVDLKLVSE
ncbi:MAG TPA: endonuclease/exonuclease/phosphatase family protein [Bacteroidota bacterium]|nr:endonuclease/exonuclease/phosphatase family protein [Bacteroidota bacterium]